MKKTLYLVLLFSLFCPQLALAAGDWYLDRIQAPAAWKVTEGAGQIVVAVIDTGASKQNIGLPNLWRNLFDREGDKIDNDENGYIDDTWGWNFVVNRSTPEPDISSGYIVNAVNHGTFISGIIAAVHNSGLGVRGIAPNVKVMNLPALDALGSGSSYPVAEAINYAVDNGADVINLSFGGEEHSNALKTAILNAYEHNVIIVAAAGNSQPAGLDLDKTPLYPICYDNEWQKKTSIGVSSLDQNNKLSEFSNFGSKCVDIAAPGELLTSLAYYFTGNSDFSKYTVDNYSGTSFATAMVTATVALMKSIYPKLTAGEAVSVLRATATDISSIGISTSTTPSVGLLNVAAAVQRTEAEYGIGSGLNIYLALDTDRVGIVDRYSSDFTWLQNFSVFGSDISAQNVTSADIDSNGHKDLIIGTGAGNLPLVRSVNDQGVMLDSFLAYPGSFRGGVRAVAGYLTDTTTLFYVVVPQSESAPVVKVFDRYGQLHNQFLAFDKNNLSGLTVTLGNVLGDSATEIIVGSPSGEKTKIKVFSIDGELLKTIHVFTDQHKAGVNLAVTPRVAGEVYQKILVATGAGDAPLIEEYSGAGAKIFSARGFDTKRTDGIRLTAGLTRTGQVNIFAVNNNQGNIEIRVFDSLGRWQSSQRPLLSTLSAVQLTDR